MTGSSIVATFGWTAATLAAYVAGRALNRLARGAAAANPTLIAIVLVGLALSVTGTPYGAYARATAPLSLLLTPAVVALGVPLAKFLPGMGRDAGPVAVGLLAGSSTAMISGVLLVRLAGGDRALALAMLPKAATSPVAMATARQLGADPSLAAVLAILGGIVSAMTVTGVCGWLRADTAEAVGLAAGVAGSGIGASRVVGLSPKTAAFAAVGVAMNAVLTAVLAPLVASLAG